MKFIMNRTLMLDYKLPLKTHLTALLGSKSGADEEASRLHGDLGLDTAGDVTTGVLGDLKVFEIE